MHTISAATATMDTEFKFPDAYGLGVDPSIGLYGLPSVHTPWYCHFCLWVLESLRVFVNIGVLLILHW